MDIIFLTSVIPYQSSRTGIRMSNVFRGMGPYQLAWYLRKFDYSVQILDFLFMLPSDQIVEILDKYITKETKIVGLGMLAIPGMHSFFFTKMAEVLKQVKEKYPWVTIVGGGPTSNHFERNFPRKTFDYIIIGHAENTMLALSNYLIRNGEKPIFEITPSGVKVLRESSTVTVPETFDIQHCGHRFIKQDLIQYGEALPLETTRGCIFKCKFCQYPHIGKKKRDFLRSMEEIKDELLYNYENFGTTYYYILDDTFNADKERVEEFWRMTQTLPFKIRYATYVRLDLIEAHPDTSYMLQESGLVGSFFGVETLNPEAALMIGKAFSGKKAREYLPRLQHDIWKNNIMVHIGLIAGFPQETFEDLQATQQWCIDSKVHSWHWNPLFISNNPVSEFSSEFDRNAEQYGFHFLANDKWISKDRSFDLAEQWATKLISDSVHLQHAGAWSIPELLSYPSVTLETLRDNTMYDLKDHQLYDDREAFLRRYFAELGKGPTQ